MYRPDLASPESVDIVDNCLTVLFVGNLKPEKGLKYLIDAVGELSKLRPVQCIVTTERDFKRSDKQAHKIRSRIEHYDLEERIE